MPLFGGPLPPRDDHSPGAFARRGYRKRQGRAALSRPGYLLGQPVHTEFFPNRKRLPASIRGIQRRSCCSRSTPPPRGHVGVHEMFGGIERFIVHTDELPARSRAAAPDDTLEGRPVSKQSPEPVLQTESSLDDELS